MYLKIKDSKTNKYKMCKIIDKPSRKYYYLYGIMENSINRLLSKDSGITTYRQLADYAAKEYWSKVKHLLKNDRTLDYDKWPSNVPESLEVYEGNDRKANFDDDPVVFDSLEQLFRAKNLIK